MITHGDITFDAVRDYLKSLIGQRDMRRDRRRVCVAAMVEFGSQGFGIVRVSWQRDGEASKQDAFYEFDSPAALAFLVKTGKLPAGMQAE